MTVNSCYPWEKLVHICLYPTIAKIEENPKVSHAIDRIWGEIMTSAIYRIQRQN